MISVKEINNYVFAKKVGVVIKVLVVLLKMNVIMVTLNKYFFLSRGIVLFTLSFSS